MTDEDLRGIETHNGDPTLLALVDEVRRLRRLIEDTKSKDICPWCGGENWYQIPDPNGRSVQGQCFKDCPAFTPGGTVR